MSESKLNLTVFPAKEADVNAFVLSDGKERLIVDCTRNSKEAHELATIAKSEGPAPQMLLITHGHPDHYIGMGALKQEFPKLNIVVARKEIKDDIIGFTKWMESMEWLECFLRMGLRLLLIFAVGSSRSRLVGLSLGLCLKWRPETKRSRLTHTEKWDRWRR